MPVFERRSRRTPLQAAEPAADSTMSCLPRSCEKIDATSEPVNTEAMRAEMMAFSLPPFPAVPPLATPAHEMRSSRQARRDDDRDDDDEPKEDRPRRSTPSNGSDVAKAGMGVGMILLIVGGVGACCLLGVVGVVAALLFPAISKVREAAARVEANNNMKQIALAMHSYHDVMKILPTPKKAPGELSWRVTILPYVEQAPLFARINENANWDNREILDQRPSIYDTKHRPPADMTQTHFQYFTGPATMFPDPQTRISFRDITDGTSNTFLLAEAASSIPWTKPADMVVTPNGPLPLPADRFLAAMADGSVRLLDRKKLNDATLRNLINPRDGMPLPPDWDQ